MKINCTPPIGLYPTPGNGNGGIVPPWLQKPPVIVLPVEPNDQTGIGERSHD